MLVAHGPSAEELDKVLGGALKSPSKLPPGKGSVPQQVRQDFLGADARTVLATLDLEEVRMSLAPGAHLSTTALGKGVAQSTVEISAAKATLRFAPAIGR